MHCLQGFMIQSEAGINAQMPLTMIALIVAADPVLTTLAAVCTVALLIRTLGVMTLWWPATPYWLCSPSGCALGRVGCC